MTMPKKFPPNVCRFRNWRRYEKYCKRYEKAAYGKQDACEYEFYEDSEKVGRERRTVACVKAYKLKR